MFFSLLCKRNFFYSFLICQKKEKIKKAAGKACGGLCVAF